MDRDCGREQLDADVLDAVFDLIGRVIVLGEKLASRLCVPTFFVKALHTLERPMAMKDLGKLLHCDPSFVTVIADSLEERGLARREARPGDRRVKNLVLTDDGLALKHLIDRELAAQMPWSQALSGDEREQLLRLIRKMLAAQDLTQAGEVSAGAVPAPAD